MNPTLSVACFFLKSAWQAVSLRSALTALLLAPLAALHAPDAPQQKPNVVFIFTDDQPQSAIGCMGHAHLATPHIDRLAQEGVLFENSFVRTSIRCVSRASILTGQHMARHGIRSFDTPLSPGQLTQMYPMLLRAAGYRTASLSRWAVVHPRSAARELCLPAGQFDLWQHVGCAPVGGQMEHVRGEHSRAAHHQRPASAGAARGRRKRKGAMFWPLGLVRLKLVGAP
jgi:arylsulfatase A-like enzyme